MGDHVRVFHDRLRVLSPRLGTTDSIAFEVTSSIQLEQARLVPDVRDVLLP